MNQQYYDQDKANLAYQKLPDALAKLGFSELRGSQKPCIHTIFGGQDVFCVLATGGGKTALAVIPTLVRDCHTIIFSPLIALMKDQIDSLNNKGIRAGAINSTYSETENWYTLQDWTSGLCKILYVAPERIAHPEFQRAMKQVPPGIVVIDEAHTMSQWSSNFRPAYARCGDFVKDYPPEQVIALTATATPAIIGDVAKIMGTEHIVLENHSEERSNLHLSSEILHKDAELFPAILKKCRQVEGSVIVYCPTTKQVENLTSYLVQAGESATHYHGGMSSVLAKEENQNKFMGNNARIMVATNSFGMGIDKQTIEAVIHAGPPGSIESVAQEIGRAARDGRDAMCHMFVTPGGLFMQQFLWNNSNPSAGLIQKVAKFIERNKDSNGDLYMTGEQMDSALGENGAQAALGSLVSLGCITRYAPERKEATVIISPSTFESVTKTRLRICEVIKSCGFNVATRDDNRCAYKIDMNELVKRVEVSMATVTKHLRQMQNDGLLTYVAPFSGKVTKFLRPLTEEDVKLLKLRREMEWEKVVAVRNYIACPDKLKHKFLNDYFNLKSSSSA